MSHSFRQSSDLGPIRRGGTDDQLSSSSATSASISMLRKRLQNFTFNGRNKTTEDAQDSWGPLGLQLLYSPSDPLIDFVFVHGLRGGSRKTWCQDDDIRLYWPRAWLARDPDLENVRIHSFGYNSDWAETSETNLDIHDFGRSLFVNMLTSPHFRRGKPTPILLIGHSMGGLVIKKAFLLAQQDPRAKDLAQRIQSMFFLATPHRGSETAKLLNNVLRLSTVLSSKSFVADLDRNSGAISVINDEFRFWTSHLQIWSFYETVKTRIGANAVMIVNKDSAIIGDKNEIIMPLDADHRHVCKFKSPSDPNYITIRNSLVKAVEDILGDVLEKRMEEINQNIESLASFMHIVSQPADDLEMLESKKTKGSCQWVTDLESFEHWRDFPEDTPLFCFWLSGQPGAGKSVLASHIIRNLQKQDFDTCYFFFRHGQKAQQTTSSFLRGLAFQMAVLHPPVREALNKLREAGVMFDKDDERVIWRKIFVNAILPIALSAPQYWILDGLDECLDSDKLFAILYKLESSFLVRILCLSRPMLNLEKGFERFENRYYRHSITDADSQPDIRRFAYNNSSDLPVEEEYKTALIERLVKKSAGAFLWIVLAFQELRDTYSEDDIEHALSQVPGGMTPLYNRILEDIAKNTRHFKLIQTMLEWTTCGTRPLSIVELQAAMALSLNTKIRNMGKMIDELCGQLLRVDKNGLVQLVHATVRDILMDEHSTSVFKLDKAQVNERLARTCLQYLVDEEMRPPRHPALLLQKRPRSVFADYACTSFSEHLVAASSVSDELFLSVDQFFRTNVLSWMSHILAEKKNLYYISRTSKNLRRYLDRRAKYCSPSGPEFSNISQWQLDLMRLILKFGNSLLRSPLSLHFVVPPLCPVESSIYKQFGRSATGLQLDGFENSNWDDCICYIDYRRGRAMSLASCDDYFAIGMRSGTIKLYKQNTCEELISFLHEEPVKLLVFDSNSRKLASAGYKLLNLWTIDGKLLWSIPHGHQLAALKFMDADTILFSVGRNGRVLRWNTESGARDVEDGQDETSDSHPNLSKGKWQTIMSADVCPRIELMAIAYRGKPPQIWSIERDVMLKTCNNTRDVPGLPIMPVAQALFNPNTDIELIAVAYQDGELAIYNPWIRESHEIKSVHADALTLAATADGRTLASGDAIGTINIWDFETLIRLYSIRSSEFEVRSLAFSGDGYRLYDIRDTKTKVWEPSVLVRKMATEEWSVSESITMSSPVVDQNRNVCDITTLLVPSSTEFIFVGREEGEVQILDGTIGRVVSHLYSHPKYALVKAMAWGGNMLASADTSNNVLVYALERASSNEWMSGVQVFNDHYTSVVHSLTLHPTIPWLVVYCGHSAKLVDLKTRDEHILAHYVNNEHSSWLWSTSTSHDLLLEARNSSLFTYSIGPFGSCLRRASWDLQCAGKRVDIAIEQIFNDEDGSYLAVLLKSSTYQGDELRLLVYEDPDIYHVESHDHQEEEGKTVNNILQEPMLTFPAKEIHTFLGFYQHSLVYLDRHLWVRSIKLKHIGKSDGVTASSARHFFVSQEFIGSNNGLSPCVTQHGTMIFPRADNLGIVKHGMDSSYIGGFYENLGVMVRPGIRASGAKPLEISHTSQ